MALPNIPAYALPTAHDLPAPRKAWTLAPHRAALLVHDMQQYFLVPYGPDNTALQQVVRHIQASLQACRSARIPVFFTAQHGNQQRCDRGLQAELWGPGMRAEPAHQDLHPALQPLAHEHVLTKHRYSAFQRSNLAQLLRVRGRDQLLITGVYAHIGCMLTAAEAFQHDVEPFLVADALADFSREQHLMALQWAAATCATPLLTSDVLAGLAPLPARSEDTLPCN